MSNDFYSGIYNPDVLSCLANLSNDEVFTPPEVANSMLDMLPQELFSDPNTKFLDPACKSGVFLREIAKRLLTGLEPILPAFAMYTLCQPIISVPREITFLATYAALPRTSRSFPLTYTNRSEGEFLTLFPLNVFGRPNGSLVLTSVSIDGSFFAITL